MDFKLTKPTPEERAKRLLEDEGGHNVTLFSQAELDVLPQVAKIRGPLVTWLKFHEECPVTDKHLSILRDFPELQYLGIIGSQNVTDRSLELISGCEGLITLELKGTGVIGSGFDSILRLEYLQDLNLGECSRLHPRHVTKLKSLPALQRLRLPMDDENPVFTDELRTRLKAEFGPRCKIR